MPATMDAFIQAVTAARRELIRTEGQNVSIRELIRRAGFDDSQRPGVAYHLNPQRHRGLKPHRVPQDVIKRLASVLPVTEEELSTAAAIASGFNVVDRDVLASDVTYVVSRFFGDERVSEQERHATTARILQIITEQAKQDQVDHDEVSQSNGKSPATS